MVERVGRLYFDVIEEEKGNIITMLSATTKKAAEKEAKKRRGEIVDCSFHNRRRKLVNHQEGAR